MTRSGVFSERTELLLLDTHVLVWSMFGDKRLGEQARDLMRRAARLQSLRVSAITPWEIGLLVSKKRLALHLDVMEWVHNALARPGVTLVALEPEIAVASTQFSFAMHSDPADRILVATARRLGATLVTADEALLALGKAGHLRTRNAVH